jgi:calcium-sensing receptor
VGSDNDNFEWLDHQLQKQIENKGGCVAFSKKISSLDGSINSTAKVIASNPSAKVIICDCYHFHFRLLAEALQDNATGKIWVFSTSFFFSPSVLGPRAHSLVKGSLNLAIPSGTMPDFENFLLVLRPSSYPGNSLMRKLWEDLQGCRWPGIVASTQSARTEVHTCTGLENISTVHLPVLNLKDMTATYRAYLATKALLFAYQNLISCTPGKGPFL